MTRLSDAEPETIQRWRTFRLYRRFTVVLGWISWLLGMLVALIAGEVAPTPGGLADEVGPSRHEMKGSDIPNATASLVLSETTGWPGEWQFDLKGHFAARWQGRGACISGTLTVTDRELLWAPTRYWRALDARAFSVQFRNIGLVEAMQFSSRACGLVVHIRGGGAAWLLLRSRNTTRVLAALRALTESST